MDISNIRLSSHPMLSAMKRSKDDLGSKPIINDAGVADRGFTRKDQMDMQRLGKRQELMRNFRPLSALSFTVLIQGTWEFLLIANNQGLENGGRAGLFWSYVWTFCGFGIVMTSMAEMASMAPTSGGQYHWVSEFAPLRYQKFLSYLCGWMSTLSWQAGTTAGSFLTGTIAQALITVNIPDYEPKAWQGTLFVFAMTLVLFIANTVGSKALPTLQNILLVVHVFGFFTIVIVLWVMSERVTPEAVFLDFENLGGWSSMALSLMVGQVTSIFASICSDAAAHMAEEVSDAGRSVPNAMFYSFILNGVLGAAMLITILFVMTDLEAALDDPTGYPFMWIFQQAVSVGGVNALTVVLLVLVTASNIGFNASAARQTWAFARDQGLPFAEWLGQVDNRFHIPFNSIVFSCALTCLLSLINLASTAAFSAIMSLQVSALMFTYVMSISCVLWRRCRYPETIPLARWSLGRYGVPVNVFGVLYASFAFFWSFWPASTPVEVDGINWAPVLFIATVLGCIIMYFAQGRKRYIGPVASVEGRF